MDKIQLNTARISELSDSIQLLTVDLDEVVGNITTDEEAPLTEKKRAYSLSNAVNSLAESISSEAGKIDQLRFEDTTPEPSNEKPGSPTVVSLNTNKEDQRTPALSPAWYEYDLDGKVTDLMLIDGLNYCFRDVRAISVLLMSAGRDPDIVINEATLCQTGLMLCDKMSEADHFVELWSKANTDIK